MAEYMIARLQKKFIFSLQMTYNTGRTFMIARLQKTKEVVRPFLAEQEIGNSSGHLRSFVVQKLFSKFSFLATVSFWSVKLPKN